MLNIDKFTVSLFEHPSTQTASSHSAISYLVSSRENHSFVQCMTFHIREVDTQSVLLYYVRLRLCKLLNIHHFMGDV